MRECFGYAHPAMLQASLGVGQYDEVIAYANKEQLLQRLDDAREREDWIVRRLAFLCVLMGPKGKNAFKVEDLLPAYLKRQDLEKKRGQASLPARIKAAADRKRAEKAAKAAKAEKK